MCIGSIDFFTVFFPPFVIFIVRWNLVYVTFHCGLLCSHFTQIVIVWYFFILVGERTNRKYVQTPQTLHLKEGCPVILTTNLSASVVNGSRGKLIKADEDQLVICLTDGRIVKVGRINFTRFDPSANKVVASRFQFPLVPAFALTFHKCQGGMCMIFMYRYIYIYMWPDLGVA